MGDPLAKLGLFGELHIHMVGEHITQICVKHNVRLRHGSGIGCVGIADLKILEVNCGSIHLSLLLFYIVFFVLLANIGSRTFAL